MQPQIKSQQYQPEDNGDLMRGVPEGLAVNHKKDNKLTSQQEAEKKVREMLNGINVPILIDILVELKCRATGGSQAYKKALKESLGRVFDGIYLVHLPRTEGFSGKSVAKYKEVDIHYSVLEELKKEDLMRVTFHELLHVLAGGKNDSSGFIFRQNRYKAIHLPINEGFTELFTDVVISEYYARTGEGNINIREHKDLERYPVYRLLSEKIIDIIAEESEVPRDVVVKSMLGHYMRADWQEHMEEVNKLASEELRKLFKFSRKNLSEDEMWEELNSIYKYETGTFIEKIKSWGLHLRRKFKQYKYMRPHVEAIFGRDAIGYLD